MTHFQIQSFRALDFGIPVKVGKRTSHPPLPVKKGSGVTPQSVRESRHPSLPCRVDKVRPSGPSPPVPEIPTPVPDSRPPKTRGGKRFIAEIDCGRRQRVGKAATVKRTAISPPRQRP